MSLYGYIKWRVLWYKNNSSSSIVDISPYIINFTTTRTFDPINNRCDIGMIDNDLLYQNGNFLPEEGDKIFVYAKIVTDAGDTDLDSLDIIWNGKFVDHKRSDSDESSRVTLNIVDWGYDVFNTFNRESYNGAGLRANEILTRMIQSATEEDDGSFRIDTSLIASTRNDGSPFPVIDFSQVLKPNYDLFTELSQTNWTNSELEITNDTRVIELPMILDFRGNYAIWQEQDLSTALTIDDKTIINDITLTTQNEGATNRLTLDCGDDLDSDNITIIIRDENSSSSTAKDAQKTRQNIAGKSDDYDNSYHYLRVQAVAEGWTNADFRKKVKTLAESYSNVWFETFGRGKPQLKVTLPKINIELGQVVSIQKKRYENGFYKISRITDDISETAWTTTLTMEKMNL